MGTDRGSQLDTANGDEIVYCARHPQVETPLRCGRCETPICPRCLVQTPVGARCRDCAGVTRLGSLGLTPVFLARGLGAAIAVGLAIGAAWGFILGGIGFAGFFSFFVGMGIGWLVAEAISYSVKKRTAPVLSGFGVLAVLIAYFTRNIVLGVDLLPQGDLGGYIAAGVAMIYAARQLNR